MEAYTCVYHYLKKNDLLEFEKYRNHTPEIKPEFKCDNRIQDFIEFYSGSTLGNLQLDKDFAPHIECLEKTLRSFNISDSYILKRFYFEDTHMSVVRKEKALCDTSTMIVNKIELAQEICIPELMFGDKFDKLYEDYNETETESDEEELAQLQENYCQVEHLIATTFEKDVYWFNSNPNNINVTGLDCEAIWHRLTDEENYILKTKFENAFVSPSPKELRCVMNTIRDSEYSERLAAAWTFRDIRLSDERYEIEKKIYVNFMTKLYADVMKCRK